MFHPTLSSFKTVLAIGAHPDDIEIGCGGTLLRLTSENRLHVHWAVMSGTPERREEASASAAHFLHRAASSRFEIENFRDTFFPDSYGEIKETFLRLRERVSPDLILTHRREDLHQDHRLLGELTWNVFRDHLIFEYEIPKYEGDLCQPNVYVALEESHCADKVDRILQGFPSQRDRDWFSADTFWALLRLRGVEADPATHFAEAFHCRKLVL
jgi:LmbE family N-acetylglucosaminyl deacetylase